MAGGGGLGVRKGSRGYKCELFVSSSSLLSLFFCQALRVWPWRLGEDGAQTREPCCRLSPPPHIQVFGPLGINAYECILMPWHLIALAHLFGGLAQFTD